VQKNGKEGHSDSQTDRTKGERKTFPSGKLGKTLISLTIVAIKAVLGLHTYSCQAAGLIEMHGKVKSFRWWQ